MNMRLRDAIKNAPDKIEIPLKSALEEANKIMIDRYRWWYEQGYNPILCRGFNVKTVDKRKAPIFDNWSRFTKVRLPDDLYEKQLQYLKLSNKYGLGVMTGFNGLLAYDIDSFEYVDAIEQAYIETFGELPLKDTYIEKTKQGIRLFFQVTNPPENASSEKIVRTGKEVSRYFGRFAVVAPTVHASSKDNEVYIYVPLNHVPIKKVTWEQILEFEELTKSYVSDILDINEEEDKEFKSIDLVDESQRAILPEDKIEEVAQRLSEIFEPYWKEGNRWAIVLALSYFFARVTKVSLESAEKIIDKMCELLGTEDKRRRELVKKVYNAYRRLYNGNKIAYKTYFRDELGLNDTEIYKLRNRILNSLRETLGDLCLVKSKTAMAVDVTIDGVEYGKILLTKYRNKYLLEFKDSKGNIVAKRILSLKQLYDERFYTTPLKKMKVNKEDLDLHLVDIVNETIEKAEELDEIIKENMIRDIYTAFEELNNLLEEHGFERIDIEEVEDLFQEDKEKGTIKLSPDGFASLIMEKIPLRIISETKDIYIYIKGKYVNNEFSDEINLEKIIELMGKAIASYKGDNFIADKITNKFVDEVLGHIRRSAKIVSIKEFNDYSRYINIENGVFDLETKELLPHSPEFLFTWKLPVKYDPEATCPNIEKFINSVVKPEDVRTLWKIMAYCLIPKQPFQVLFILMGEGSNGKSTYLKLVETFLGKDNVSHVALQDLEHEKFSRVAVVGKLANICADLPKEGLKSTSFIKQYTGGDSLTIEPKFKNPYTIEPDAKLIFSANQLPEVDDTSPGFWRRIILIEFPYKFEKNPKFFETLTTEEELSGLFNKVIEYIDIVKEEGFNTISEVQERWMKMTDPLTTFVSEHISQETESYVSKDDVWNAFYKYCKKWGILFPYSGKGGKKWFFRDLYEVFRNFGIMFELGKIAGVEGDIHIIKGISLNLKDLEDVKIDEKDEQESNDENNHDEPLTKLEDKILDVLRKHEGKLLTPIEIADAINVDEEKVEQALEKLLEYGEVYRLNGKYGAT